jgi:type I restriction enzyme S subunit
MEVLYKETQLGKIPCDWEIKKLGEILVFKNGLNSDKSSYGSGIKFINIMEIINNNVLDYSKIPGEVNVSAEKIKKNIVKNGDLIFNRTSETNEDIGLVSVYLDNKEVVFGGFVIKGTFKVDCIDNSFKKFCFRSNILRKQIIKYGQGAIRSNIGQEDLSKVRIALPSLSEQKAIADCLSAWENAIELQIKLIETKKDRKKALMQQLLTGKKRLPGFTEEWKEFSYSQLIKQVTRKEKWDDLKIYNLISIKRRSGGIFARQSLYGRQIEVKQLVKVKENDFLISKMQIVHGASSIVRKEFEEYYVSGSYIILNIKDEKVLTPFYLDYMSKQKIFYHQTYIASYGVHIEKMTFDFKSFLKMKITLPSLLEQGKITKIIDTAEKEIQIEKQKLADLQKQKKGLMQQLLTGKVRLV